MEDMSSSTPQNRTTDESIKDAINSTDCPFATAGDVADTVSLSSEGARQRLLKLVDRGEVERAKVGGSAVVYWLPESK